MMAPPAFSPPDDEFSGPPGEAAIRRAMREGQFDNLRGQGQPLRLSRPNPFADEAEALANDLLSANGFAPAWIESRREIEARIEAARRDLRRALQSADQARRLRGVNLFRDKLAELNRAIRDHNLGLPDGLPQMALLRSDLELERAGKATSDR